MITRRFRQLADRWRHRAGRYSHVFEPYDGDECVSLDCETTGLDPTTAEILSIGAVRVSGNRVKTSEHLDIKLEPPDTIDEESIRVHRIRGMDLADGITPTAAMERVLEFVGNRPLLGYYIAFDVAMLDKYLEPEFGFRLPNRTMDLAQVYRSRLAGVPDGVDADLRLETIAAKLDMPPMDERHTALGDAIAVALMYVRLKTGAKVR